MPDQVQTLPARRGSPLVTSVIIVAKFAVTVACFWYLAHVIDLQAFMRNWSTLHFGWVAVAVIVAMLQIPLVGLRWGEIVDEVRKDGRRIARRHVVAITAIGVFFTQVTPFLVGDTLRAWLLTFHGADWRQSITSVLIDRGAGVLVLMALGFAILLLPSAVAPLGMHRALVLAIFGAVTAAGVAGLALAPYVAPMLERLAPTRWLGQFAAVAHRVLLGSAAGMRIIGLSVAIHALTILCIWSLGRALGVALPLPDAAVLFTLMVAVSVLPISIGGWGLRELTVTALLRIHDVSTEQSAFLSICYGLTLVIGSFPGLLVWALYSPRRAADRHGS